MRRASVAFRTVLSRYAAERLVTGSESRRVFTRERRPRDRLGRPDRLGGGAALRLARARRRRHRQRHAPAVLRAGGVDRLERRAADQRPGRVLHALRHRHPGPRRACRDLQPVRAGHRGGDPHRRSAEPRLGGARPAHRLRRQRRRHAQPAADVREHCIEAPFIHCSTNKVYGDRPNRLPLVERERAGRSSRAPVRERHQGGLSIDDCLHSVFGASKVAADVMVQEYGRYFDMRTACFRGGTLTGPAHSATELHGYLAYVMRCAMEQRTYKIRLLPWSRAWARGRTRRGACAGRSVSAWAGSARPDSFRGYPRPRPPRRSSMPTLIPALTILDAAGNKPSESRSTPAGSTRGTPR